MSNIVLDIMAIPLTQGLYALVDGEDYKWLNQWKWFAQKDYKSCFGNFYACRKVWENGRRRAVLMHREILNASKGTQTDHRNHCGLDNRKTNLRPCNYSQNAQNRMKIKGSSKYKGVYWHKEHKYKQKVYVGKWLAQINFNGQQIYLGLFDNQTDAAKAYDNAAKKYFGEFAELNFFG